MINSKTFLKERLKTLISIALSPAASGMSVGEMRAVSGAMASASSNGDDAQLNDLDRKLAGVACLQRLWQREIRKLLIEKVLQRRVELRASDVDTVLFLAKHHDKAGHAALAQRFGLQPRYLQARLLQRASWPEVWANAVALERCDGQRPGDLWPTYFDDAGRLQDIQGRSVGANRVLH